MRLSDNDSTNCQHQRPYLLWQAMIKCCKQRALSESASQLLQGCVDQQHLLAHKLFHQQSSRSHAQPVDLLKLVHEIRDQLKPLLTNRQLQVFIDGSVATPALVDRDRFYLAVWGLMLEATMTSRVTSEIEVCIVRTSHSLELEIADSSERSISEHPTYKPSWALRCAEFLLSETATQIEATNCPQGGIATRLLWNKQASRMAA